MLLCIDTHVLERSILHHEHNYVLDISKTDSVGGTGKRQ